MSIPMPQQPRVNRSKNCSLCGKRGIRQQRPAPIREKDNTAGHEDKDYKVAVCPNCDFVPPLPANKK